MSAEKKVERKVKLKIEGLRKSFRSKVVLQELDLEVFNNESMVVLGGSGTGKSVLIKTIVGLISPDAGTIKLDDDDITNISGKGRDNLMSRFGFLFQGGALFDSLAVWENISFFLTHNKYISKQEAQEVAEKKLKEVGLDSSVMYLHPSELSGGMQKRVALARAIAGDPEIIFFDEPTTGLDPIMANVINDLIKKCRKKLGSTTITITHDIDSARKIASRVAMLYQGKIIWVGNIDEIDDSGNPVFDQFIKGKVEGPIKL